MWDRRVNWCFETDPDPNMNGRRIYWPRGKTLGGSSSINGLIYIRGQREDYDHWAALGNPGWGWDDVLPYFRQVRGQPARRRARHGADGPLKVSDIGAKHELIEAFIAGARQRGVRAPTTSTAATRKARATTSSPTSKGWRCSTAKAYLKPARGGPTCASRPRRRPPASSSRTAAPSACATARAAC